MCLNTLLQDTLCILRNASPALTQGRGTAHDTQHKDAERQPQLPVFLHLVSCPPGRSSLCPITTSPQCFTPPPAASPSPQGEVLRPMRRRAEHLQPTQLPATHRPQLSSHFHITRLILQRTSWKHH